VQPLLLLPASSSSLSASLQLLSLSLPFLLLLPPPSLLLLLPPSLLLLLLESLSQRIPRWTLPATVLGAAGCRCFVRVNVSGQSSYSSLLLLLLLPLLHAEWYASSGSVRSVAAAAGVASVKASLLAFLLLHLASSLQLLVLLSVSTGVSTGVNCSCMFTAPALCMLVGVTSSLNAESLALPAAVCCCRRNCRPPVQHFIRLLLLLLLLAPALLPLSLLLSDRALPGKLADSAGRFMLVQSHGVNASPMSKCACSSCGVAGV
jgi:hypothetical protein